jgi:hypothetical protein
MEIELRDQHRQRIDDFRRKHRIAVLTTLFTDVIGSMRLKQILGDRAAMTARASAGKARCRRSVRRPDRSTHRASAPGASSRRLR